MTIATELGKRISGMRYESLPPEAIHAAKVAITDLVGCALAGANEDCTRIAQRVLAPGLAGGPSLVWGTPQRVLPMHAAAINGTAAHALDYDDINNSLAGHPSAPIVPAVYALAEQLGSSGRDVLLAYVTGFETQSRIGKGVHLHHYQKGWHPTSTLGVFGAAAGSARLLGLDAERTAVALAIASSLSSGLKANFGTMTKPLHAGQCAMNGLYAALLAREGFTANTGAFEHKQGFLEVFNGAGNYDAAKILERWCGPFDVLDPGVTIKPYPCCGSTHAPIDAAIWLREKHGLTPDAIARVESVTHANALMHTDRADPRSELDAKFSVQYCVARALMHGEVRFEHFENAAYEAADVRSLLGRISVRPHAHAPKSMDDHYESEVSVTTRDGRTVSHRVEQPLGTIRNPAPAERLEAKFRDCASRALRADAVPQLLERLQHLEEVDDVNALSRILAASREGLHAARAAA